MDILNEFYKKLKDKSSLSLDEKKRYLYLMACQKFSYDSRYHFLNILGDKSKELKKSLLDYQVDLRCVQDFCVICHSFSKAYLEMLEELLNVKGKLEIKIGHGFVSLESSMGQIQADATCGDLTRIKMLMETEDYQPYKRIFEWNDYLKKMDSNIGYTYIDHKSYINNNRLSLRRKVQNIEKYYNTNFNFKKFEDAKFALEYLLIKTLGFDMDNTSLFAVAIVPKENLNYENWQFFDVLMLEENNLNSFFYLVFKNGRYYLKEMSKDEIDYLSCNAQDTNGNTLEKCIKANKSI